MSAGLPYPLGPLSMISGAMYCRVPGQTDATHNRFIRVDDGVQECIKTSLIISVICSGLLVFEQTITL